MVQLNAQSNGKITSRDLKEALKTVAQQNGAQVDLAQSKALIEKVFLTDNQLSRGEVRKALDENQVEAAHIVKETALPASTPVIQQVMQVLEASDAGMIDKVTLQAALKQVAKDERIVIDAALTTGFVQQVFQSADSDNQGEVTRQKVEMALASHNVEAFQLFKEQVVVPVQSDSVSKKLMNVLSTSQKGTITAKDLKEALKVVATQNGQTASSSTCNAFVDKVFLEADSDNSGQITRSQLREFIEDNQVEAAQVVKETTKVSSNPVTLSVIQTLEESESGVFDKKQVAAAVKQVAVENGVTLNSVALQSMVSKVFAEADFNTQGTINRQALHTALDSHAVEAEALFQDKHITVKNDPVVAKVLNVLEGSETGLVTKADLRQALKTAVSANGKQIDSAQSNALIEQVYFAVDSDRSGQITRSQLREGLD
jgi:Ca2+-binding EF-hand superfamily protein